MYIGLCGYQTHAASELFWKVAKFYSRQEGRTDIPLPEKRQGDPGFVLPGMMPEFAGIYAQSVNIETRNTCGTMSFVQLFCIKA